MPVPRAFRLWHVRALIAFEPSTQRLRYHRQNIATPDARVGLEALHVSDDTVVVPGCSGGCGLLRRGTGRDVWHHSSGTRVSIAIAAKRGRPDRRRVAHIR